MAFGKLLTVLPILFELKGSFNNCDFIPSTQSKWKTGTAGAGYTHDVQISIRGGGGRNGRAIGKVVDGKIDKILITSGGLFYTSPTYAKIHAGGWRSISRGNAPLNDTLIPAGSASTHQRKHPHGVSSLLKLLPFAQSRQQLKISLLDGHPHLKYQTLHYRSENHYGFFGSDSDIYLQKNIGKTNGSDNIPSFWPTGLPLVLLFQFQLD